MSTTKADPHVQRMIGEATMMYAYREFQQAIQLLLEVVRVAPGLPHAYQTLGLIYEETGQVTKALKLFMMAAHLSKRDVHQWEQLAQLAKQHGEVQQCIYCLQRVLALKPDDQDAQWEHALLLSETGEHRKAARALLPLLRNRPDDTHVVRRLVRSYHRLGHVGKAIHLLEALLTPATPSQTSGGACGGSHGGGSGSGSGGGGGVDLHALNMLLELLIEGGRFREALARVQQCRARTGVAGDSRAAAPEAADGPSTAPEAVGTAHAPGNSGSSGSSGSSGNCGNCGYSGSGAGGVGRGGGTSGAGAAAVWPVELSVKEGVCHAYMGDLPTAEQLWARVLRHPERTGNLADLLYEIALCYFHLQQWSHALPLLHALRDSELYR